MVQNGFMRHPRYGVVRTLLGGEPDVNRRLIVDSWNDYAEVMVFNQEMATWTPWHESVLKLCLKAMNKEAREQDGELRHGLQYDQGADDRNRD